MDKEMQKALEADGEKLRAMTGEDHGPFALAADWRDKIKLNDNADARLTMTGGMSFEVWMYILRLENAAHHDPLGEIEDADFRTFYDDDYTPHDALEEDFQAGF